MGWSGHPPAGWRHEPGRHEPGWHGWHGWRRGPRGPGLAVLIALVQSLGTMLAARDQPQALDPGGYALLVAGGLALAARVRYPVATMAVVTATTVGYTLLDYPSGPTFVALIIAGVAAVTAGHRYPVWGIAAAGYAVWVGLAAPPLGRAVVLAASAAGALVLAELRRVRDAQRAQFAEVRAERARVRAEQRRREASEQRLRIAQELHDVLGHHLSLINVQAGVGLHLMDSQPEQARAALGAIKQASAEALREVRSVLASLRPVDDAAPRAPAPGLARLDELTGGAGLPVHTAVTGTPRPLPGELDRTAYRIVQEALTNVRRHAGAGATATVAIEYREKELVVQVDDDGGGAAGDGGADGGDRIGPPVEGGGIGGMRERVAALGGSLTAGVHPESGRGFRVRAHLPLPVGES